MSDVPCQHLQIAALRQQLAQWEGAAWRQSLEDPASLERAPALSSGCPALDRALPGKGFRPGTLVEWLGRGQGDGAATLAFRAAAGAFRAAAGRGRGAVVVLDRSGEFYPPAAVAQGIGPARLIVVHPANKADHNWALDQALRCPAVAAVVAWPDLLDGKLDGRTFRRLQLAVEQGGGLGLLIRPESVRGQPSWADVRLLVEPLPSQSPYGWPRRLRVVLLRCRGGGHHVPMGGEQTVEVEIDHETHPLPEN
jgi:protein ImuA